MLGDKRFLTSIRPRSILSFGPDTPALELKSLNVLIGPNGSGKSNLLEVISLLQAAPGNLLEPIQTGGGIAEWLWKGSNGAPIGEIDATFLNPQSQLSLRHHLGIAMVGQRANLVTEAIYNHSDTTFDVLYTNIDGVGALYNTSRQRVGLGKMEIYQSILSQRKDPDRYPEITFLGNEYAKIKLFREWNLGRSTQPRKPQPTDLPGDFLSEDAANIALVLNDLEHRSGLKAAVVEKLRVADEAIRDVSTKVSGGSIQLYLHYAGLKSPVPATRLSDGTMRYLCLLAVLCHPEPPPLVCIEEPELGLHPDLLPSLADLLIEASHRMQLIVTTHSDVLVDGLTKVPEAVVVCEKHNGSTVMSRKSHEELSVWLDQYGLGQLWRKGEIGGNRW